jgi:hypothetical protein
MSTATADANAIPRFAIVLVLTSSNILIVFSFRPGWLLHFTVRCRIR